MLPLPVAATYEENEFDTQFELTYRSDLDTDLQMFLKFGTLHFLDRCEVFESATPHLDFAPFLSSPDRLSGPGTELHARFAMQCRFTTAWRVHLTTGWRLHDPGDGLHDHPLCGLRSQVLVGEFATARRRDLGRAPRTSTSMQKLVLGAGSASVFKNQNILASNACGDFGSAGS